MYFYIFKQTEAKTKMEIIRVNTPRGLELKGVMWGNPKETETVLILTSGFCSNVFQNDILAKTGELLNKNNIACIIGHTMDAFSCIAYSDFSIHKQRYTGVIYDDINAVYEDVESYVKYAKELGFKNIILAGHSLGSNKIIHYLANTPDDYVNYFIVSAPVDLRYWFYALEENKEYLKTAQRFIDEGRGRDILPFLFCGASPISAQTLIDLYNAENLNNCPVISGEGETESLGAIKINGAFVIGGKDSMSNGDPKGFIEKINSYCRHPEYNKLIVIPDASHIFYGKHNEYAETILGCINNLRSCITL